MLLANAWQHVVLSSGRLHARIGVIQRDTVLTDAVVVEGMQGAATRVVMIL